MEVSSGVFMCVQVSSRVFKQVGPTGAGVYSGGPSVAPAQTCPARGRHTLGTERVRHLRPGVRTWDLGSWSWDLEGSRGFASNWALGILG